MVRGSVVYVERLCQKRGGSGRRPMEHASNLGMGRERNFFEQGLSENSWKLLAESCFVCVLW